MHIYIYMCVCVQPFLPLCNMQILTMGPIGGRPASHHAYAIPLVSIGFGRLNFRKMLQRFSGNSQERVWRTGSPCMTWGWINLGTPQVANAYVFQLN